MLFRSLLNAASFSNQTVYKNAIRRIRQAAGLKQNRRLRDDANFYIHYSALIHLNNSRGLNLTHERKIKEAESFIENNKHKFPGIRLSNFYFDLAKSYFFLYDFEKANDILHEIYQNQPVKGQAIDFYVHSRLLYCLTCFELNQVDLMISAAKSVAEFMKRNLVYFNFEKRIINFIVKDLPFFQSKSPEVKMKKFQKLKSEFDLIFDSPYEAQVLKYFNYYLWIENKIAQYQAKAKKKETFEEPNLFINGLPRM